MASCRGYLLLVCRPPKTTLIAAYLAAKVDVGVWYLLVLLQLEMEKAFG